MAKGHRFTRDVKQWAKEIGEKRLPALALQSATEAYSRLKQRTPIDTGNARAGWYMTLGDAGRPGQTVHSVRPGDRIRIANGVVYIVPLEYGHSKQAPSGMLRITVAEWPRIVDAEARKLNR